MRNKLLEYMNTEKPATGGLLFMTVALIITLMFIITITMTRMTMSRSVAESVEHTVAMECLASCYVNPTQNALSGMKIDSGKKMCEWNNIGEKFSFQSLSTKNTEGIEPLNHFNTIMQALKLMSASGTSQTANMNYTYYTQKSSEGYNAGQATFTFKAGEYTNYDSFWTHIWKIQPNEMTVTIENSYSSSEEGF